MASVLILAVTNNNLLLQDVAALESQPLLGFFLREEKNGPAQKLQFKLYHKNTLFYIFKADDIPTAQRYQTLYSGTCCGFTHNNRSVQHKTMIYKSSLTFFQLNTLQSSSDFVRVNLAASKLLHDFFEFQSDLMHAQHYLESQSFCTKVDQK